MKAEMDMSVHSCSFYCDNPPCIKAQRDEMRAEMEAMQAKLARVRDIAETWQQLSFYQHDQQWCGRSILEALEDE